jgi:hypothetical protein
MTHYKFSSDGDPGEEIESDLMDLIDPDLDNAVPILRLAGRLLYVAMDWPDEALDDAGYERALLRSANVALAESPIA